MKRREAVQTDIQFHTLLQTANQEVNYTLTILKLRHVDVVRMLIYST